jgi:hypothetical protein
MDVSVRSIPMRLCRGVFGERTAPIRLDLGHISVNATKELARLARVFSLLATLIPGHLYLPAIGWKNNCGALQRSCCRYRTEHIG